MKLYPYQQKTHSATCRTIDEETGWGKDDFLGIEPFKQGYQDQIEQKIKNLWSPGSLGYVLYEMGIKDAQNTNEA